MLSRIRFDFKYFTFWLSYFFVSRVLLLLYYFDMTSTLPFSEFIQIPIQGLKLDLSMAAYISILPFLLVALSVFVKWASIQRTISFFTTALIFLASLLAVIDLGLYGNWGGRLDSTFLVYANTPVEMLSSITTSHLILAITSWLMYSVLWIYIYRRFVVGKKDTTSVKWWSVVPLILFVASIIFPIRGGFQTIPINQSNVYFSKYAFANHAAVNYCWNFMKTYFDGIHGKGNKYAVMSDALAKQLVQNSKKNPPVVDADSVKVLKTNRPNVILIIWESLTAKAVKALNGREGITPNLHKLSNEGLLFSNFYANGSRSDKGLVALLSGYYPQPNKSILKSTRKSNSLPLLPVVLQENGYHTSFYYGGNMNFGNMNTYLMHGMDNIISGDDFTKDEWNSKWGAHDEYLIDRYILDKNRQSIFPFFDVIFTLSSHEPFEFPSNYKFGKNTEEQKFLSSLHYTDEVIGGLIDNLKSQSLWDNTLVIITGDHGHPYPKEKGPHNGPRRFQIPMIWVGGALEYSSRTIGTIGSQIDVAHTLLKQMDLDPNIFEWGMDLSQANEEAWAQYIYSEGFGLVVRDAVLVYDYQGNIVTHHKGDTSHTRYLEQLGKANVQINYDDFIRR